MSHTDYPIDPRELLEENRWLSALARRLIQDAAAADDVVQETWAHYVQNPPRQKQSKRSWLARVLRSRVVDRWRDEDRRKRSPYSFIRSSQERELCKKVSEQTTKDLTSYFPLSSYIPPPGLDVRLRYLSRKSHPSRSRKK